jgi:hypothetical protein
MSVFQKNIAIESEGETLEDSVEWALFEDGDGLDSDVEESNDSSFESMNTVVKWHNKTFIVSKFELIQICVYRNVMKLTTIKLQ